MGGTVPTGYDVRERRLVVNPAEAATVREIYARYLELGSIRLLKQELDRRGMVSKIRVSKAGIHSGGRPFSRGALHELLSNPVYVGEIRHRKDRHPGQQEAIVDRELWDRVQLFLSKRAAHPLGQSTHAVPNLLAGKLFDEAGEPLYVCGATKGQRRYRYYVSRSLIRSPADQSKDGWRLAAPEVEGSMMSAAAQLLKDHAAIGAVLHEAGFSAQELVSTLKSIDAHRLRPESDGEIATAIARAIQRIDLRRDGFELTLDLKPLVADQLMVQDGAPLTIKRLVPLQLRRRGVELRIVMQGEAAADRSKIDPLLLKAIVRGRRWFAELASHRAADTLEIAKRERLCDSYVRRLIPLAFLAPSIVEAICSGRQPTELTAERLTRRTRLPYHWAEQQKALGLDFGNSLN
jgi:site-specific DNA recombinase